jgi:hypothetical protein
MTMCVNLVSGTSLSGWFFCEIHLGLGSEDGLFPPLGTARPSE